jgi:hypothetical protein
VPENAVEVSLHHQEEQTHAEEECVAHGVYLLARVVLLGSSLGGEVMMRTSSRREKSTVGTASTTW